jgi:glycosyltransferase involved in cell wall biosynthesis
VSTRPGRERAITVIVPTRGLRARAAFLRHAVESVLSQDGVRCLPLVVINGADCDPAVGRALRADRRVRVLVRGPADLPAALRAGREAVDTPWFASLDDDDRLLPGAMALRLAALERAPSLDVVVTNGYRRERGRCALNLPPGSAPDVNADPLRALLRRNWLLPGSWLRRSDAVGTGPFLGMPRFLECTWLAVRFASDHRLRWIDAPTVVYRVGSPAAESLSAAYLTGQVDALRRLIELPLPPDVRRALRARVARAYHDAALETLRAGAFAEAWRLHGRSVAEPGGWRFLPFTRHLARASLGTSREGAVVPLGGG